MYNFVFQIALMVSIGVMVYLFVRAVPRVGEEIIEEEPDPTGKRFFFKLRKKIFPKVKVEKIDETINLLLEKTLRKVKLVLMRMDNSATKFLAKVKDYSEAKRHWIPKQNIFENKKENEEELVVSSEINEGKGQVTIHRHKKKVNSDNI